MKKLILILLIISTISNNSCRKIFGEKFTFEITPYNGDELRIDGYYYHERTNYNVDSYEILFLYGNGLTSPAYTPIEELDKKEIEFIDGTYSEWAKNAKHNTWGIFKIDNTHIRLEKKVNFNGIPQVEVENGIILNDTTFMLNEYYILKNGEVRDYYVYNEEIYRFKEFSPKPDSTFKFKY